MHPGGNILKSAPRPRPGDPNTQQPQTTNHLNQTGKTAISVKPTPNKPDQGNMVHGPNPTVSNSIQPAHKHNHHPSHQPKRTAVPPHPPKPVGIPQQLFTPPHPPRPPYPSKPAGVPPKEQPKPHQPHKPPKPTALPPQSPKPAAVPSHPPKPAADRIRSTSGSNAAAGKKAAANVHSHGGAKVAPSVSKPSAAPAKNKKPETRHTAHQPLNPANTPQRHQNPRPQHVQKPPLQVAQARLPVVRKPRPPNRAPKPTAPTRVIPSPKLFSPTKTVSEKLKFYAARREARATTTLKTTLSHAEVASWSSTFRKQGHTVDINPCFVHLSAQMPQNLSPKGKSGFFSLHTKASSLNRVSNDDKAKLARHLNTLQLVTVKIDGSEGHNVPAATAFAMSLYLQSTDRSDFADWVASDASNILKELIRLEGKVWKTEIASIKILPYILSAIAIRSYAFDLDNPIEAVQQARNLVGVAIDRQIAALKRPEKRQLNDKLLWKLAAPLVKQTATCTTLRCKYFLENKVINEKQAALANGVAIIIIPAAVRFKALDMYKRSREDNLYFKMGVQLAFNTGLQVGLGLLSHGISSVLESFTGIIKSGAGLAASAFANFVVPVEVPGTFSDTVDKILLDYDIVVTKLEAKGEIDPVKLELFERYLKAIQVGWNTLEKDAEAAKFLILYDKTKASDPSIIGAVGKVINWWEELMG